MWYVLGGIAIAVIGVAAYILRDTDDVYEDARKHRIRQLNQMGDMQ
jgi:hypothetical protein